MVDDNNVFTNDINDKMFDFVWRRWSELGTESGVASKQRGERAARFAPPGRASVRDCACGGEVRLVAARPVSWRRRVTRVVSYSSHCIITALPPAYFATFQASTLTLSSVEVASTSRRGFGLRWFHLALLAPALLQR
ncbi:unnamed protein product [Colias eurytheme]|nr:unnamed protein product [Colias eurytheme]